MVGFYFGFALSFDFGRGEKGVGEERVERGFFLREGRRLIFFGYIYIVGNVKICYQQENRVERYFRGCEARFFSFRYETIEIR